MQNNVAILFEKKLIGEYSFAFVAVNCIEGKESSDHKFITDSEKVYNSINDSKTLFTSEKYFYGYVTTVNDLKNKFNSYTKEEAFVDYIYFFSENLVLGSLDAFGNMVIKTVAVDDFFDNKINNTNIDIELENIKKEIDSGNYKKAIELLENKNPNIRSKKLKRSERLDVKKIIDSVNNNVIGQEEAIDTITTTIALNHMNDNPKNHSNILITGPTGVGKTEILNSIAKEIDIPCVIADMSSITQEGYVGKSVDSLLAKVYNAANGDLKLAERAILALDEIDKKASKNNDDASGRAVLNSLLKILDGNVIDVNIGTSRCPNYINFDTSHLTIVSIGAFSGLRENKKKLIGFGTNTNTSSNDNEKELYFKYGMPEEFMGRMSVIANLKELSLDDYTIILLKSCSSPLLLKWDLLNEYGILFKPTSDYIYELANKTLSLKAGARGLKIAVNESLQPAINEIVKNGTYKELSVDGETVYNPKKYILK